MTIKASAYQSFKAFNEKFHHWQRNVRNLLCPEISKFFLSTPDANASSCEVPSNRNNHISEGSLVTPKKKPEQEALGREDEPMVPTPECWNSSNWWQKLTRNCSGNLNNVIFPDTTQPVYSKQSMAPVYAFWGKQNTITKLVCITGRKMAL